jgi:putative transposase
MIEAVLAMTGRVTMLGISRWTEEGGSYRTVQRFFNTGVTAIGATWSCRRFCSFCNKR